MYGQEEQQGGWMSRWWRGELAGRPGVATVALALVLGACLLGAWIMVQSRSGVLRAFENGRKLLKQVGQEGLEKYLGRAPLVRYYLIETEGKATGFSAVLMGPRLKDENQWEYVGKEISYVQEDKRLVETAFSAANDLSYYRYMTRIQTSDEDFGAFSGQLFKEGRLRASGQRKSSGRGCRRRGRG